MSNSTESFTKKAVEVHGNDKYDYSKVEYKNSMNHVKIGCREHGEFMQLPMAHLKGGQCPRCCH